MDFYEDYDIEGVPLEGQELIAVKIFFISVVLWFLWQLLLLQWKWTHYKSFQKVSLFALWIIPFVYSVHTFWINFIIVWCLFTIFTAIIILSCIRRPISKKAPGLIYMWFYNIYNISYGFCLLGCSIICLSLGIHLFFSRMIAQTYIDIGITIMSHGLYFGALSRDLSELITDIISISIGFYTESGLPRRMLGRDTCAICGSSINGPSSCPMYILNCNHAFHAFCIRGWYLIGKKQTCPYCREKVNLDAIFSSLWTKSQFIYSNVSDAIRYMVLSVPVVFITIKVAFFVYGLK